MRAIIDLPERIFEALQIRAGQEGSSVEAVLLQVITDAMEPAHGVAPGRKRIELPLVPSRGPGTLKSMTGAEIDELLR